MKIDLDKATKTLKFNEKNLLDDANVLLEAWHNDRNIFSLGKEICETILPDGVDKGSREHSLFLFYMGICDVVTNADILFERGRALYKEKPEVFNPAYVYEKDKDQLKPVETSRGVELVAPAIQQIIKEKLQHGLRDQLSIKWYKSSRKLYKVYDSDPRNIFKHVTDPHVAYRRLDMGKQLEPVERVRRNETFPRFSGFGPKTGTLLVIQYIKNGLIKGMDEREIYQPFDNHALNFAIGREIINLDYEIRREKVTDYAQNLFRKTFKENDINNIDFHYAQWKLGSEVCTLSDCHSRRIPGGKERLCPFSKPCKNSLDSLRYRKGYIAPSLNDFIQR